MFFDEKTKNRRVRLFRPLTTACVRKSDFSELWVKIHRTSTFDIKNRQTVELPLYLY